MIKFSKVQKTNYHKVIFHYDNVGLINISVNDMGAECSQLCEDEQSEKYWNSELAEEGEKYWNSEPMEEETFKTLIDEPHSLEQYSRLNLIVMRRTTVTLPKKKLSHSS